MALDSASASAMASLALGSHVTEVLLGRVRASTMAIDNPVVSARYARIGKNIHPPGSSFEDLGSSPKVHLRAVLAILAFALVALPCLARAQYIDPVCEHPWQEVQGNGCRTRPIALAVGGAAACLLPTSGLALLALRRRRTAGRGD